MGPRAIDHMNNSVVNKVSNNPKTVLVITAVVLFLAWPGERSLPASCPKTGTRYGIMFDAGSTGSRVHVFELEYSPSGGATLKREVFEELKPGLSAFKDDPKKGAESLLPLLNACTREVPRGMEACTPIVLKATAGLRLIGKAKAEAILQEVRNLFGQYKFFLPPNGVEVMDGKDEGPFAWLTVNFLLGTLTPHKSTAAIMDLGGGSTQIVFVPDSSSTLDVAPSNYVYDVNLFGSQHRMYQHSHLGFGLKEAAKSIRAKGGAQSGCLPQGFEDSTRASDFDSCLHTAKLIFHKEDSCTRQPCSFKGVYQPNIKRTFSGPVYAFSYFYDRMEPFLNEEGKSSVGELREVGRKVCKGGDDEFGKRNLGSMCMDFVYLYALMSHGYDLPDDQVLYIKKKINGVETAWALGAMVVEMK